MLSLTLAAALLSKPAVFFDAVERAHGGMTTGSLRAEVTTGTVKRRSYDLVFRTPTELRVKEVSSNGQTVRDRFIGPESIYDFDPALGQYVLTPRSKYPALGDALAMLDPELDELILTFADPKTIKTWLSPFKELKGWKVVDTAASPAAKYSSDGRTVSLTLEPKTGRIAQVKMTSKTETILWKIVYRGSVSDLTLVPPPDSTRVARFDSQMLPPKYANAEARKLAAKLFSAYEGLQSLGYVVARDSRKTTVLMSGKFVRQEDTVATWTYDGKLLTLFEKKSGRWFKGERTFTEAIETVPEFGTRVDPTLRLVLTGVNPYRKRFGYGATLSKVGTTKIAGEPVSMLTAKSEDFTVTVFVRDRDGLALMSTARAPEGSPLANEAVDLTYTYVAVPPNAAKQYALALPKGTKPLALPAVKKIG